MATDQQSILANADALIELIKALQPSNTISQDGGTITSRLGAQEFTFTRNPNATQRGSRNIR